MASLIGLLLLTLASALVPAPASAHPLGNFTINRYSRLDFSEDAVNITYVLDFAEIPTFQEMKSLDTNTDAQLSEDEARVYLDARLPELIDSLRLVVGDSVVPLTAADSSAAFIEGQGGLPTLRIEAQLTGQLPAGWQDNGLGEYTDRNYQDRLGWRELVVRGGEGVAIESASASATDVSNELRSYPDDRLASPLDMGEATFTLAPGNGTVSTGMADTAGQAADRVQERDNRTSTDRVASLITAETLSPGVIAISLLVAMFWGAVHALSPGHGKTVVAAYLVGARGTAKHAAFLGLTVTLTHTAGVFALGLVTLYLSRYIVPEDLYPWLSVASGALVVVIGASLFWSRMRGRSVGHAHDHGHSPDDVTDLDDTLKHSHGGREHTHLPPGSDGAPVTWRSLLALGVSGGLIPCPSALVLLLGAISLDRLELGMLLVVAFSFGLAAVLTAIGMALVYARRLFERHSFTPRVPRLLPAFSALAVCVAGLAIMVESLRQTGLL